MNEERLKKRKLNIDKIRGSLIGGAAGDALGYVIEFDREDYIFDKYGKNGICEYEIDRFTNTALISDDTQMTLFTANGLLFGSTRMKMRGIGANPHVYVKMAYLDWMFTQRYSFYNKKSQKRYVDGRGISWLLDVPELYCRRAPGNTCLKELDNPKNVDDYIKNPVNNSKGCGGIMRVAPLALLYDAGLNGTVDIKQLDMEGAYIAAITHGHPLGYMPAMVVTHIINRIVYGPDMSLKQIIIEARDTCKEIFAGFEYLQDLLQIIDLSIELSENNSSDTDNIHKIGEGWVAEETLGIALYCALRYQNDFSKAITVAVNHNGDSDSTGAVTGNIVGAIIGYEVIENKWKEKLELHDTILEIADDLCHGCQMSEYESYIDLIWESKYIKIHLPNKNNIS